MYSTVQRYFIGILLFFYGVTTHLQGIDNLEAQKIACGLSKTNTHKPWNWKLIEMNNAEYPAKNTDFSPDFIWGVGTSSYQVEGGCSNSTYNDWEQKIQGYTPADIACDHWHRYKEDIQRMKNELGVNSYRFSIEWSKVQPSHTEFNEEALTHYVDVCNELIKNNIRPVIGFHHYSDPQWFMNLGGFAKAVNNKFFVAFCTKLYTTLSEQCSFTTLPAHLQPLWLTFNSPASYAANGYITGSRPPGKKGDFKTMVRVLKNMLNAHVQVYHTIKALPSGEQTHIGITHNILQLDPYNHYNPLHRIKCYYANLLVHTCVYDFFARGVFSVHIPFKVLIHHVNTAATTSLDFVGLNYYSHCYMDTTGGPQRPTDEISTDNPMYSIYPEGLYRAIHELYTNLAHPCGIPIIITENGIASRDETKRELFLKRHVYVIKKACQDGYPIQGYIHWSLMDNFEWGNYSMNYGLYSVDRTTVDTATGKPTLTRTLRPSSRTLTLVAQRPL